MLGSIVVGVVKAIGISKDTVKESVDSVVSSV